MIGTCQYMTCRSPLGTSFRCELGFLWENYEPGFDGRFVPAPVRPGLRYDEILLCPEHERLCETLRRGGELTMTDEGYVYGRVWMDALAFRT